MLTAANLTLRFLLELPAVASLGSWGFRTGSGPLAKVARASALPPSRSWSGAPSWRRRRASRSLVWALVALVAVNLRLLHGFGVG